MSENAPAGIHKIGTLAGSLGLGMRSFSRFLIVMFAAFGVTSLSTAAVGQIKQIELNERQIESFITAHRNISLIGDGLQAGTPDKPDSKIEAALEAAAKKYGFKDFFEYDNVAANISMIMAGFDPQTKTYTEPRVFIQREIDETLKSKTIPQKEKKQLLQELNDALKSAQPLQFPSNGELVKKRYDQIEKVLQ